MDDNRDIYMVALFLGPFDSCFPISAVTNDKFYYLHSTLQKIVFSVNVLLKYPFGRIYIHYPVILINSN